MSAQPLRTEPQQRAAVVAEALSWLKTPYHHHGRIKGEQGGVDCLMLLAEVFERAGMVPRVEPGEYARDWHQHHSDELYMQGLMAYAGQLRADEIPQPGDIVLFKFGLTYSHAGIVTQVPQGGSLRRIEIVHSYLRRGVTLTRLAEEPLAGPARQFWSFW